MPGERFVERDFARQVLIKVVVPVESATAAGCLFSG